MILVDKDDAFMIENESQSLVTAPHIHYQTIVLWVNTVENKWRSKQQIYRDFDFSLVTLISLSKKWLMSGDFSNYCVLHAYYFLNLTEKAVDREFIT